MHGVSFQTGMVPVNYIQKYEVKLTAASPQNGSSRNPPRPSSAETPAKVPVLKDLPALARAIKDRLNIHDDTQLRCAVSAGSKIMDSPVD